MLPGKELRRVAVDARCLNVPHLRGMGKALLEVVCGMRRHSPHRWELYADRPDLPFHEPPAEGVRAEVVAQRGFRFHAWEQYWLPRRVRRSRPDLLHCPATRAPWWQPVPTVVTVHDAIPWAGDDPDWPPGWYRERLLPAAYHKAAALITDSECSRRDILSRWPELADKTRVIPLGIGERYLQAHFERPGPALEAHGVRPPYLLYLGGSIARKRLDWAVRIVERLDDPDVRLVVCGVEEACWDAVRAAVSPAMRARLCFLSFVPEDDMPGLYQNAAAVLYPSLYEGFGLPVLEAQAVGTPALFSALGSLAELQGPASVVLPAEDLSAWVSACGRLLRERREGARPDERAREWVKSYSWDRVAARVLAVYREVLDGRARPTEAMPAPVARESEGSAGRVGVPAGR
jgi:glycosyltransferase involved in cell wall biosynthesis